MALFVVKRVVALVLTLLVASFLIYGSLYLAPGDPATQLAGGRATPEVLEQIREQYKLNDPFLARYWDWLTNVLQGDLGQSFVYRQDVSNLLAPRVGNTVLLVTYASILILGVGVSLGLASALRRRLGSVVTFGTAIGMATPAFVAADCPGATDPLLLVDSTPVECARRRETVERSALGEAAEYGWCAAHSRYFWGFRLHLLAGLDGTPRAIELAPAKRDEREVALELFRRTPRAGGEVLLADKGYAGEKFATAATGMDVLVARPAADEPDNGIHLVPIRQPIESIILSLKGTLGLERHGARTLAGLRERILCRLLCLAACIWLNRLLGRRSRALVSLSEFARPLLNARH